MVDIDCQTAFDYFSALVLDSAFFKSLRQQSTLTELILKSCRLFDEGMADLADIVFSLGGLNVLNISLNGLTAAAVTYLTRAASKKQVRDIFCTRYKSKDHFTKDPICLTGIAIVEAARPELQLAG